MNSDNEREGRALIQAWKNACSDVEVQFDSARRDSFVRGRGRITTFDERRIVVSGLVSRLVSGGTSATDLSGKHGSASADSPSEIEVELIGARFGRVGSRPLFKAMGLDPDRHAETVEISLRNMDRLVLATVLATGPPEPMGFWGRFLRTVRQRISLFLKSTNI
jgi:hypothetical protein